MPHRTHIKLHKIVRCLQIITMNREIEMLGKLLKAVYLTSLSDHR